MAANPVNYENRDGIGIIIVNNPPLNALSREVRDGLLAAIRQAEADESAHAIVLTGAGQTFSAGADITEFDSPLKGTEINQICDAIEDSLKPVVAALHGTSLGEGLEIALACHYRIASKDAGLGLPEVKLGLIPGGGGTQRLPRLTGAKAALDLIISGDPISAGAAQKAGIVDEIAEGDHLAAAMALAKSKAGLASHPKTREQNAKIEAERGSPIFDQKREELKKRQPYQHAPLRCVAAVESAFALPFEEGLRREGELFNEALQDWQSKALIHAFFAERHVVKIPGLSSKVKPREIKSAGVIGTGTMGGGIAMAFANAGIPVVVLDRDQAALYKGLGVVAKNYESMVQRGRIDQAGIDARMAAIKPTLDYGSLADADIVVEAAVEDLGVKEPSLSRARPRLQTRRDPGLQHLHARYRQDREFHVAPRRRGRHAFLLARQRDAARRDRARQGDKRGGARQRHGGGARDRQDRRFGRQLRRLCRQSHAGEVHHRGHRSSSRRARRRPTSTRR